MADSSQAPVHDSQKILRVRGPLDQPEQAARTYAQGDAAERAYEGRQTEEAVRSRPAEAMIIDEGDAGRKKASQEAVEGSVMELAAYGAETVIRICLLYTSDAADD